MWDSTSPLMGNTPAIRRGQKTDSECFPTNFHGDGKCIRLKGYKIRLCNNKCDTLRQVSPYLQCAMFVVFLIASL